jgi:uncharacterized membrane protein required for colicin V production
MSKEMKEHFLLTLVFQTVVLASIGGVAGLSSGGIKDALLGMIFGAVLGVVVGTVLVIRYSRTSEGQI